MSEKIKKASQFAARVHEGQYRKGEAREPYTVHLEEVAGLVEAWGGSEEAIVAAWLHDTVEDCNVTLEEIEREFGSTVCGYVRELTDDKSLEKQERKKLQVINASKKSSGAALIKLADKTSNIGALKSSPPINWSTKRKVEYIDWAETVVSKLPKVSEMGAREFLNRCRSARLSLS